MHDVGAEKWALALGSDLVLQLPRWRDIERLFDQIESVWVFNRVGAELDKPWEALPESLANRVSWRLMPQILPAVSSTLVRDNWKAQEALLPESVREVLGRLAT